MLSRDPCYPWEKKPTNSTDHADNTDAFVIFDPEFSKKAGGNVFFAIGSGKWNLLLSLPGTGHSFSGHLKTTSAGSRWQACLPIPPITAQAAEKASE